MNQFHIYQNNINGFYSKAQILEQNLSLIQPHVCMLQECFRSPRRNTEHHTRHLYNHYWSETGRTGVFCRRDLHSIPKFQSNNFNKFQDFGYESCWIQIFCPGQKKSIMFCSFYRNIKKVEISYEVKTQEDYKASNIMSFRLDEFEKEVKTAHSISEHIIICGDWNAHNPAWLDKNTDEIGHIVLEFIFKNNLHILNNLPFDTTFYKDGAESSVDISLCSSSLIEHCNDWRTDNDELDVHSDHLPITFNISSNFVSSIIKRQKIESWNLRSSKWEIFRKRLDETLKVWHSSLSTKDFQNPTDSLEYAVETWTQCIVETGKETIGVRTTWKGNKNWWDSSLHRQRKKVQKLKRNFRKFRTQENYYLYKEEAKSLKRNLRRAKQEHMVKCINSLHDGNIRQVFSQFRSLNENKITVIPTLIQHATQEEPQIVAESDFEKAELLVKWFAMPPQPPKKSEEEHYQEVEDDIYSFVEMQRDRELAEIPEIFEIHQSQITEEEVIAAIRHISPYKAQGPDWIHNLMLKNGGQSLIKSLVFLFNWSFSIGHFPRIWKKSNIVAIPKPERDHSLCKNYRPISLLSCVGKLLERIITMRLIWYLDEHQLLHYSQAGFQSWHNTSELLLRISESIHASFDKNAVTYAAMLDISAAYDSVWRDGLRYKMRKQFNLQGRLYWWIDSFLKDRVGQVVLNGLNSRLYKFETGVPQGSSISPLLFLLYINDLADVIIEPIQCGMFADDVALWTAIETNSENEMQLQLQLMQQSLDGISSWGVKWKMLLAPEKSQCITFKQKNKKKYPTLKLNLDQDQVEIPEAKEVKYLGLIMDSQLSYKQHINYVYGKASRKLGYLIFLCSYKGIRPSLAVYNLLYKTIIRPILEYACPFWNGAAESHKKKLERIQRLAMVKILGVMNSTAYDTVNIISQIPPLELRRKQEEIKLYHKCIRWSGKLRKHNLTLAYNLWRKNHPIYGNKRFSWMGKLSTLSRACIHAAELKIPEVKPDTQPHVNISPVNIVPIPHSRKSPFPRWSNPSPDEILSSLGNDCVILFVDGSTSPNPGISGAGLVIQDPSLDSWIELEYPIKGITTNIGCEIEGIRKALEYIIMNYKEKEHRVIILSDCKMVISAILNQTTLEGYNFQIAECQRILNDLGELDIPEIYWIKGHSGIPGNEKADEVAKRARRIAQTQQPELYQRPDKSTSFLNMHELNPFFTKEWNRHWINEGSDTINHQHPKSLIPNLIEAQIFEKIVLHRLETNERRIVCRLITGKVGLNKYLNSINRAPTPYCACGTEPETVEHYLMKCKRYSILRQCWYIKIKSIIPTLQDQILDLKRLLIGERTWPPDERVKAVKELVRFVISSQRNI